MDTGLFFGQFFPLIALAVLTLAIVEAAGAADTYEKLPVRRESSTRLQSTKSLFSALF